VPFWNGTTMWTNASGADYSPACALLNVVPGVEEEGGLCNSTGESNATLLDAISSDPNATSRLSSGRPLVSVFVESGACAEIEAGECWSTPGGFASYQWTNELVGLSSGEKMCMRGVPGAGQPSWGIGCAVNDPELRVLAWMADGADATTTADFADAADAADASGLRGEQGFVATRAHEKEDWYARSCGLTTGLDVRIGEGDWNAGSAGSPRWKCFDIPGESNRSDPMRMLVQSVGELPCAAASTTSEWGAATTALSGGRSLAAVAAAAVVSYSA